MAPAKKTDLDAIVNKMLLVAILGFVPAGTWSEKNMLKEAAGDVKAEIGAVRKDIAETKLEVLTLRAAFQDHTTLGEAWKQKIETRLARAGR